MRIKLMIKVTFGSLWKGYVFKVMLKQLIVRNIYVIHILDKLSHSSYVSFGCVLTALTNENKLHTAQDSLPPITLLKCN